MSCHAKHHRKNKQPCFKLLAYALMAATVIVLLLAASAVYLQVLFLTTPQRNADIGTLPGLTYQVVSLTTADGLAISGWYVPGSQPNGIVLVHGVHANRAYLIPQAIILAEAGYHLLLIDLRGHGLSAGANLTYGYQEALDVQAAVNYLLALPGVEQVGVLGHSLGAAATVREAASDERVKAIVIQSSYSSLADAVEDAFDEYTVFPKWPFAPLITALAEYKVGLDISQIDSAHSLATMPVRPVLIIHSRDDGLFPFYHAQKMYDMAQEPKQLWAVSGIGHVNPIMGHEAEYKERILHFFAEAFTR